MWFFLGSLERKKKMEKSMSLEEVVEEIMRIHRSLPTRPGIEEVEAARTLIQNLEKEDQSRLEAIARQKKRKDVPDELFKVLQEMQRNLVYSQSKEQKREALKLLDLENVHAVFDDLIQRASKCLPSSNSSQSNAYVSSTSSTSYSRDSSSMSLTTSASFSGNSLSSPAGPLSTTTTTTNSSYSSFYGEKEPVKKASELISKDDSYLKKAKTAFHSDGLGAGLRSGDVLTSPQIVDSTLKPALSAGMYSYLLFYLFQILVGG